MHPAKRFKGLHQKVKDVKHVKTVIDPFENKDVEDKLVSKDKKSVMIPIETTDDKNKTLDAVKILIKSNIRILKGLTSLVTKLLMMISIKVSTKD